MFENPVIDIVWIVLAAALGLVAGFALGKLKGSEPPQREDAGRDGGFGSGALPADEANALRARAESLSGQVSELSASNARARAQVEGLEQQLAFAKSQLVQAQQAEQVRLQQERERTAQEAERRRDEQAKAMTEQSKVIAALAPVQKNLDALQRKVTQIEEGRKGEMGALGQQLKGLGDQQARLDKETSSLSAALTNNKVRGAWGEAQLRNIVESAGLLEHVDFDTQVVVTDPEGNIQRPDMVIHLPGGKSIPIDAKVPYSDYQRACEIPDTAEPDELRRRDDLMKAHAKALREHVKTLGGKAYWNAFDTAPDFVIAFIPNDALLETALQVDPTLMDDAFAQKVALTSPVTLWAVLKSVAFAWQQQSLTDDAKMLFDLSRELYDRFAVLGENASKLGASLTKTVSAYNKFAGSLESRVLVTARKMQKIDSSKVIEPVDMLDSDKANVRELTAPELQYDDSDA